MSRQIKKTRGKVIKKRVVRRKLSYKRIILLILILVGIIWGSVYGYDRLISKELESANRAQAEVIETNAKQTKPEIPAQYNDERFKNYSNILIIGVDDTNTDKNIFDKERHADALELLSYDKEKDVLRVITIPRNLVVINSNGKEMTISDLYYQAGGAAVTNALANYLEIPITQYIAVDRSILSDVVNALGGIALYVPENMNYEDPADGTVIHLRQGYQLLDGKKAAEYISYRSDTLGDSGRLQRQQQIFKLLYKKFTSVEGIKAMPKLFKIIVGDADTNIKLVSYNAMLDIVNAFKDDDITVKMLPGNSDKDGNWVVNNALVRNMIDGLFPVPENDEKK